MALGASRGKPATHRRPRLVHIAFIVVTKKKASPRERQRMQLILPLVTPLPRGHTKRLVGDAWLALTISDRDEDGERLTARPTHVTGMLSTSIIVRLLPHARPPTFHWERATHCASEALERRRLIRPYRSFLHDRNHADGQQTCEPPFCDGDTSPS